MEGKKVIGYCAIHLNIAIPEGEECFICKEKKEKEPKNPAKIV